METKLVVCLALIALPAKQMPACDGEKYNPPQDPVIPFLSVPCACVPGVNGGCTGQWSYTDGYMSCGGSGYLQCTASPETVGYSGVCVFNFNDSFDQTDFREAMLDYTAMHPTRLVMHPAEQM
jgi:hypothetical protein